MISFIYSSVGSLSLSVWNGSISRTRKWDRSGI